MATDSSIFQGVREFSIGNHQVRCECSGRKVQPVRVYIKEGGAYLFDRTVYCKPTPKEIERAWLDSLD